jgi:uncharacterized cupredoxin-like copper-binding protein
MSRNTIAYTILTSLTIGLSACSSAPAPKPVAGAQDVISKADWSKSQTVNVALSSYAFSPQAFTLKQNQPYVLHLTNTSDGTHTFSSDTLFSAVAVEKIVQGSTETAGISTNGVTLAPNQSADVYVVPVTAGTYHIYCAEFMHDSMGMHGDVTIQQ